jgi:alpha-D-ribose 1-methylphosphonate 5-triphosphate diphosphatase
MSETVFSNARVVLADEVVLGSVLVRDGRIADIGAPSAGGEDFGGDYLLPGFVELHTDALEFHYKPRPRVRWSPDAAIQQHDAQVAASGITTVFDALRVGLDEEHDMRREDMLKLGAAIGDATIAGRLRVEHFIHLRCEVSAPDCLEGFRMLESHPQVKLASLMDHAPGQRQFQSIEAAAAYYQGKLRMSDADFAAFIARRNSESSTFATDHRNAISQYCRAHSITLASHDDATLEHVDEALAQGIDVAEFPTTIEAARASHDAGLAVLMGAPNVVRGGSHSGNISARSLVGGGLLDILSSDYIPFSLMQAVFVLSEGDEAIELPQAVRLVSKHPAEATGLDDRGEIAVGRLADLVRVETVDGMPVVRTVWREGRRVI